MPIFRYQAVNIYGKTVKGIILGDNSTEVEAKLRKKNLTLIELKLSKKRKNWFVKKRVNPATLSLMTYELGTYLSAGYNLASSIGYVAEQTENPILRSALFSIKTRLTEGYSLSFSMGEFPLIFPSLYREVIAAGFKSNQLNMVIEKLGLYLEQQEKVKQKLKQALIYPILLVLVSTGIMIFLLVYTMPKIINTFTEAGQSLPGMTLALIGFSYGLKHYGIYILLLLVGSIIIFKKMLSRQDFRFKVHKIILKTPIIGALMLKTNSARFLRTLGILYAASIPIEQAMEAAEKVIFLLPMCHAVHQAIEDVKEGKRLHQALEKTHYFSRMITQLIASGEMSNTLEMMLEKTSSYQDAQVERWVATTLALFEPAMILIMGGIVLFIVLAILLPVFQMGDFFH